MHPASGPSNPRKYIVLRGEHWHDIDPDVYRLCAHMPGCCETVCDDVAINEPFVTLISAARNKVFVQVSDVVLIEAVKPERASAANDPASGSDSDSDSSSCAHHG